MLQGLTLNEMAQKLTEQQQAKRDFVAETPQLEMNADGSITVHSETVEESFTTTHHTHTQIGSRLGIPAKYYRHMQEKAPDLLANNVNHWFQTKPELRMLRTLDGNARAFLSNRYRRIDNYQIAEMVMPILSEFGEDLLIGSIAITDNRFYIKAINQRLTQEVKKGDLVQAGVSISNSEIGLGSIKIEPLVYRLACTNGMIVPEFGMKKYHVGRSIEAGNDFEIFQDDTRKAEDEALLLKVRDMVRAATNEALFTQIVGSMQESTTRMLEGNPAKAVEVLSNDFSLRENEHSGVLTHLIQGGDLSQYGLLNAVTRTSQDLTDYDRATHLETLGSKVLELSPSKWKELATVR